MASLTPLSETIGNEKVDVTSISEGVAADTKAAKKGFFAKHSKNKASVDKVDVEMSIDQPTESPKAEVPPVSIGSLFRQVLTLCFSTINVDLCRVDVRFSTKTELLINLIGLVAAAAAGTSQV